MTGCILRLGIGLTAIGTIKANMNGTDFCVTATIVFKDMTLCDLDNYLKNDPCKLKYETYYGPSSHLTLVVEKR